MFTYIILGLIIFLLSAGYYNRYQAEKETISGLLSLSSAEFEIVRKVVTNTRIEPSDISQSERFLIKRLEENDWFVVFNDGAVAVGGKSGYLQRKNTQVVQ